MSDYNKCKRCGELFIGSGTICNVCINEIWDIREQEQNNKERTITKIKNADKLHAPDADDRYESEE